MIVTVSVLGAMTVEADTTLATVTVVTTVDGVSIVVVTVSDVHGVEGNSREHILSAGP